MKKNIFNFKYLLVCLSLIPFGTYAALTGASSQACPSTVSQIKQFKDLVCIIIRLCLDLVPVIILLAVVAFLSGLIGYVANGDNEEKRSQARMFMIYGIIGFFVMVAVWGMLQIAVSSFGVPFGIPQFKHS